MEFATSALILLALLMPGVIFNNAYSRGFWRWNSPTSTQSITEQIPGSVITAGLLHFIWIQISSILGHPVHLKSVLMLLLGNYGHDEAYFGEMVSHVTPNSGWIISYFVSLYAMSALLGYVSHWSVRSWKLDRKWRVCRFNNEWFYLLTGEVMEFPDNSTVWGKHDGIEGVTQIDKIISEDGVPKTKPKGVFLSAVVDTRMAVICIKA